MKKVLLGKKIGMTRLFQDDGSAIPVTVIEVGNNVVSKVNSVDSQTIQIEYGKDRLKKAKNVLKGNYKDLDFVPRYRKVFNVKGASDTNEYKVGDTVEASQFEIGEKVRVTGTSKGKGFIGVVKRWGFKGGPKTHGQSDRWRAPGAIGAGTTPGRVLKGKKMPGRAGREQVSVKNLRIVDIDDKNKTVSVSGSVPGSKGSYVYILSNK